MAVLITMVFTAVGQKDSAKIVMPKKNSGLATLSGKWYLMPALESDTATGHLPEITFDIREGKFSGNTGCNRMAGTFLATDSTLSFSDKMITTRMACVGYNESAFLQNLLRVDSYKIKRGLLVFTINGIEVSRWYHKPVKPKKTGTI